VLRIEYITNLDKKISAFRAISNIFKQARYGGLKSSGIFGFNIEKHWIKSGGEGSWPPAHPFSQTMRKKYPAGKWQIKFGAGSGFTWLSKFVQFFVTPDALQLRLGLAIRKNTTKEQFKNPVFLRIVFRIERGSKILVSEKMRQLMGATRRSGKNLIGQTFFPLRKTTTALIIEPRPLVVPVFSKIRTHTPKIFEDTFLQILLHSYGKL